MPSNIWTDIANCIAVQTGQHECSYSHRMTIED